MFSCPLEYACTGKKYGCKTIVVSEHHDLIQARREDMQNEAFKHIMNEIIGQSLDPSANCTAFTDYAGCTTAG